MNDRGKRNLMNQSFVPGELRRGVRFWVSFWPLPPPRRRETLLPSIKTPSFQGIAPPSPAAVHSRAFLLSMNIAPSLTACS